MLAFPRWRLDGGLGRVYAAQTSEVRNSCNKHRALDCFLLAALLDKPTSLTELQKQFKIYIYFFNNEVEGTSGDQGASNSCG